jgi:hypothetical protein
MSTSVLNASGSVTLATVAGVVTGRVTLGPGLNGDRGPATWHVTGVIAKTTRPGVAPIPRVEVFQDDANVAGNSQGVTYDGSFNQGPCDIKLIRGQSLIAVWTGGSPGDIATFILSGTKQ